MQVGTDVMVTGGAHWLRHGVVVDWPEEWLRPDGFVMVAFRGARGEPLKRDRDALNVRRLVEFDLQPLRKDGGMDGRSRAARQARA